MQTFFFSLPVLSAEPIPELIERKTQNNNTIVVIERFDWITLHTDEKLKGDLLSMYDDELEFDSKELKELLFEWDEIIGIKSKGMQSVRYKNGSDIIDIEGWIVLENSVLTISSNGKTIEVPKENVISIASASGSLLDVWSADINLGANFSKGNSTKYDYTFSAEAQRRTSGSRFKISYIGNVSANRDSDTGERVETANSQRLTSSHDIYINEKIFFRAVDAEYYSDIFQNIDSRLTAGVALGYHLYDKKRFSWDVTAGPSYQKTLFATASEGEDRSEKSGVLTLGSNFDIEINKEIDFVADYQLQIVSENAGQYIHRLETGVEIDLTSDFDLDLTFYVDRTEKPHQDDDGNLPLKNDYRLVVSLGYSF
ncbi:DUF481 domain-containing protein [Thalassotalea sp. PLHSN55]|uniref:DUF481 domain-containing protein n=1 Tax=Thalassotalea sp. PLHSN55 TaxID=3435888 RepID=UPI003F879BD5